MRRGSAEFERQRDRPRQADLTAMGMTAQHQVKTGMGRLAIDFRRMRQQDRKRAMRDLRRRLFDVVDTVIVRVVDAGKVQDLAVAQHRLGLVDQHADAHFLERRRHPDRIVVAEDRVDRTGNALADARHARDRRLAGPKGLAAVVSGQHAQIVAELRQQFGEPSHRCRVDVDVKIAELKNRKAVERARQPRQNDGMAPDLDAFGIFGAPANRGRRAGASRRRQIGLRYQRRGRGAALAPPARASCSSSMPSRCRECSRPKRRSSFSTSSWFINGSCGERISGWLMYGRRRTSKFRPVIYHQTCAFAPPKILPLRGDNCLGARPSARRPAISRRRQAPRPISLASPGHGLYPSPAAEKIRAPVAQLDRALPSEGRGREFESRRVRQQFRRLSPGFQPIVIRPQRTRT